MDLVPPASPVLIEVPEVQAVPLDRGHPHADIMRSEGIVVKWTTSGSWPLRGSSPVCSAPSSLIRTVGAWAARPPRGCARRSASRRRPRSAISTPLPARAASPACSSSPGWSTRGRGTPPSCSAGWRRRSRPRGTGRSAPTTIPGRPSRSTSCCRSRRSSTPRTGSGRSRSATGRFRSSPWPWPAGILARGTSSRRSGTRARPPRWPRSSATPSTGPR